MPLKAPLSHTGMAMPRKAGQVAGAKIERLHALASAYTHRDHSYKNLWLPGIKGALEALRYTNQEHFLTL